MSDDLVRRLRQFWTNMLRSDSPIDPGDLDQAADTIDRLTREVDALQQWKDAAKAAEATWDLQEVGNLMIIPPGVPIRPAIQPAIERLTAELRFLQDTATLVEANFKNAEAEVARLTKALSLEQEMRRRAQIACEQISARLTAAQTENKKLRADNERLREGLRSIAVKAGTSDCGGDYVKAVSLIGDLEQMADDALRGEGKE